MVPAPCSAAMLCACAKASPISLRLTSRKAGGRSRLGANGARMRTSSDIDTPVLLSCHNYSLARPVARDCHRRRPGDCMADRRKIVVCSCEGTIALDTEAVRRGCPDAAVDTARQLCRGELDQFRAAAASGGPVTIACTQEAPLFSETAGEIEGAPGAEIAFANIREAAGWSREGAAAGPKMAALIAAAAEPMPETPVVSLESEGTALVYGGDERAIEAARLLKDRLDVTVLLSRPGELMPPRTTEFPVLKGTIRSAQG